MPNNTLPELELAEKFSLSLFSHLLLVLSTFSRKPIFFHDHIHTAYGKSILRVKLWKSIASSMRVGNDFLVGLNSLNLLQGKNSWVNSKVIHQTPVHVPSCFTAREEARVEVPER